MKLNESNDQKCNMKSFPRSRHRANSASTAKLSGVLLNKFFILILMLSCFASNHHLWAAENEVSSKVPQKLENQSPGPFAVAVSLLNQEKFAEAEIQLKDILAQDPDNLAVLRNLSLAEWKQGKQYLGLAHMIRAENLNPLSSEVRQSVEWMRGQLKRTTINMEVGFLDQTLIPFLRKIPFWLSWFSLTFLVPIIGMVLVSYLRKRKMAFANESALPGFPWPMAIFAIIFSLNCLILAVKHLDALQTRALMIESETPAHSGPNDQSPVLLKIPGGYEVLVISAQGDWTQVELVGVLRGWVRNTSYVKTTP